MSHTKRFYNKKNRMPGFYHPWIQFCCGNCRSCKDPMVSKRRRLAYEYEKRKMIKEEIILRTTTGEYNHRSQAVPKQYG